MSPDYDNNEKNVYGQFNNPDLYGVYADVHEQQAAGVNCFDTRETAAQKVVESRTNANAPFVLPIVELNPPQITPLIFDAPILPTPAPTYPNATGESRIYTSKVPPKENPGGSHVNDGGTKPPTKSLARLEKTEITVAKMSQGARIKAAFSFLLKMAATFALLLIVLIVYSSDWAKSISKKWENEAAINVFGSEQVAPMSAYASLIDRLGKTPTVDVKKLVAFASNRNKPSAKRDPKELLMYAAVSWNCISQDPNCAREINRAGQNAVGEIRSLAFNWLVFANESGNRDAAADLGLYSLKGAWGGQNSGIQSAVNYWRGGKLSNDREDRLSRLNQKYAASTDLSVLRWVRDTQGTISTALFHWLP